MYLSSIDHSDNLDDNCHTLRGGSLTRIGVTSIIDQKVNGNLFSRTKEIFLVDMC
jgi:hypothetical protein